MPSTTAILAAVASAVPAAIALPAPVETLALPAPVAVQAARSVIDAEGHRLGHRPERPVTRHPVAVRHVAFDPHIPRAGAGRHIGNGSAIVVTPLGGLSGVGAGSHNARGH